MPTAGAAGPSPWTGKQRQWERWWEAYPRRVGKKKARAAWERAVREVARERGWTDRTADWANRAAEYLQQRVEAFARSPKGQSGEFCPHPTTWLNEGRWDDPPEEWRVAGQEAREHRQAAEHRERFEAVRKVLRQQGLPINREAVQPFQAALSKAAGDVAVQAIRELGGLQWLRALDSHTLDAKRREFVEACLRRGQA